MKNIKLILIAITILILSLLIFSMDHSKTTIFTWITFFDFEKQDKWSAFCKAMYSILQKHNKETLNQIDTCLFLL
jgi:hypothetical protein